MAETWKVVVGFELYEVSSHGRVRRRAPGHSTFAGRLLNLSTRKDGYIQCTLLGPSGPKTLAVHRLVLEAFVGPSNGLQALHSDDNGGHNHLSNLRWGTPIENAQDKRRNGGDNPVTGTAHYNSQKTHCPQGHEYTPDNIWLKRDNRSGRHARKCRECHRAECRRYWARRGAA